MQCVVFVLILILSDKYRKILKEIHEWFFKFARAHKLNTMVLLCAKV